ncbi:MAG: ATP-dependent DNA helicase RecG [Marinilabiliales bacterium]|nr:MAG: ATP-dependent DNA helicase RecG [Marinilabiliales bacterium]
MNSKLDTPITYLKGVGPKKAEVLQKEIGVKRFEDLLFYFPFRYVDKSRIYKVKDVNNDNAYFQLKGKISNLNSVGDKRTKYITAKFHDETGSIDIVWFRGLKWVKDSIKANTEYLIFGKPSVFKNSFNFVHPEIEVFSEIDNPITQQSLEGIYSSTEKLKNFGLGSRGISKIIKQLFLQIDNDLTEILPDYILKKHNLIDESTALKNIHFPSSPAIIEKAQKRLKFDELFYLQTELILNKKITKLKSKGHIFQKVGNYFNQFYSRYLPFELTNAQKRVIKEIRNDLKTGRQMNRLLQGDVGSGKTMVAFMSMLIAIDNGFQTCIMAPTEILANQHYNSIKRYSEDLQLEVELLTGSTKKSKREDIHKGIQSGNLKILIGTHALVEDTVKFNNLGLAVIDEQHRFGVAQRAKLWKKSNIPPHILVMTATPIPRTLAMTVYGNLDVSVIDELPPGRKEIKTLHFFDNKRLRVIGFIRDQIKKGSQIYIVYPLISESEKLDLKNLMDGFANIQHDFPPPEYLVSVLHGRMKNEEKDYEMQRFAEGKTNILVSTTVIEVGVDVPNASVMVIENAERFGLSQLHQLRGRVGRGSEQSYCILMSGQKLSNEGRKRLEVMVSTSDGFEIAEEDLKLRGPGDLQGTRQSGVLDFKIANITKDSQLMLQTRKLAETILEKDPQLTNPHNIIIRKQLQNKFKKTVHWGKIS